MNSHIPNFPHYRAYSILVTCLIPHHYRYSVDNEINKMSETLLIDTNLQIKHINQTELFLYK